MHQSLLVCRALHWVGLALYFFVAGRVRVGLTSTLFAAGGVDFHCFGSGPVSVWVLPLAGRVRVDSFYKGMTKLFFSDERLIFNKTLIKLIFNKKFHNGHSRIAESSI